MTHTALFGLVALLLGALAFGPSLLRFNVYRTPVATVPAADYGFYYLLKASYLYYGEPLDFDIVAGCQARITSWIDKDKSVETGLSPMASGRRTARLW